MTMNFTDYKLPRIQATTPVEAFGPVPATVFFPKEQAPEGARFCEEVNAFVPADLPYRIRGIKKDDSTRKNKTFVQRIFSKNAKKTDTNLVMAMGLTHAKLHLVPLAEAQQNNAIRYHGLEESKEVVKIEVDEEKFHTKLIPLWEAQARFDIVYRGKNPLRSEVIGAETEEKTIEAPAFDLYMVKPRMPIYYPL